MMPSIDQIELETTKINFDRITGASSELFGALLIKEMSAHFSDLAAPRQINNEELGIRPTSEDTKTNLNLDSRLSDNRQDLQDYDSNKSLDNEPHLNDQDHDTPIPARDNDNNLAKTANGENNPIFPAQNNGSSPAAQPITGMSKSEKNEPIQQTSNHQAIPSDQLGGLGKSMSENNNTPVGLTLINKTNAANASVIAKPSNGSEEFRIINANPDKNRTENSVDFQRLKKGPLEHVSPSQSKQTIIKSNSHSLNLAKQPATPSDHGLAPKIEKTVANIVAKPSSASGKNLVQAQQSLDIESNQSTPKTGVKQQPISNQNINPTITTPIKNGSLASTVPQTATLTEADPSTKRTDVNLPASNALQLNGKPNSQPFQNSHSINRDLINTVDNVDKPGTEKNNTAGNLSPSLQKQNLQTHQTLVLGPQERPVEKGEITSLSLAAQNLGKRSALHVGHIKNQKAINFSNQPSFQNINPTVTNNNASSAFHSPASLVNPPSNPPVINQNNRKFSLELSSSRNIPVAKAAKLSSGETVTSTRIDSVPNGGGGSHQIIPSGPNSRVSEPPQIARVPVSPPANQVSVQISKAIKNGDSQIRLQLKPEDLGKVEVKLDITADGRAKALILVEKPETLDLLQRDLRTLDRALQDAGLKTDQNSLTFTLNGRENQNAMHQANQDTEQTPNEESQENASSNREGNESNIPATAIGLTPDGTVNFLA